MAIATLIIGFIVGLLVGRKNRKIVEKLIEVVKEVPVVKEVNISTPEHREADLQARIKAAKNKLGLE